MGKGDRKTAKGKRYNASYGNARSHVAAKAAGTANAPAVKKTATKTTAAAKAPAKKVAVKKAATKE
jgi:30S ribosomal protein S31